MNRPARAARVVPFIALAAVLAVALAGNPASARDIPSSKLALIRQAITSMRLDARVRGLIDRRVDARMRDLRLARPDMGDSAAADLRAAITDVYLRNLDGRDGLMARVEAVLDRHLSEDELRFARGDYRGSDQGKRYRELVPRIVKESLAEGEEWAARLEPEIRGRIESVD